jgi:hypothetical protein
MDEECNCEVAERGEVIAPFVTSDAVVVPFVRGNDDDVVHGRVAPLQLRRSRQRTIMWAVEAAAGEEKFRVTQ